LGGKSGTWKRIDEIFLENKKMKNEKSAQIVSR